MTKSCFWDVCLLTYIFCDDTFTFSFYDLVRDFKMSRCKNAVKVLAFVYMFNSFPVLADSDSAVKNLEGFFVGVDVAYNHSSVKNDETEGVATLYSDNSRINISDNELVKSKRRRCHIDPSVNIGYSHFFNNWYVGLAGDVSFGKNNKSFVITDSADDEGYESKISGVSYALKAKGGYYFRELNSVVYGIAGVKWREVSYRRYASDRFSSKAKLKSPSFLLGLGFEKPICKKLHSILMRITKRTVRP